jgi:hypothetical protein
MEKIIWEADVECTSCSGTGLYKGYAERSGAAVECYHCSGTGKEHIKHVYSPFVERKNKSGVTRVFKTAAGYGISDKDFTSKDDRTIKFSQAGCSYKEWKQGVKPEPIYDLHCPLEHYSQGTTIGEWLKDVRCNKPGFLKSYIPECSKCNRESCWTWLQQQKIPKEK